MSKCKTLSLCLVLAMLALCGGCTGINEAFHGMINQPKYIALRESEIFKDGTSARPLEKGTIPRGYLKTDTYFYTGKISGAGNNAAGGNASNSTSMNERGASVSGEAGSRAASATPSAANQTGAAGAATAGGAATETDGNVFPYPVTKEMLDRGQERFQIFCSMCHGLTGYGDGMVVRRGYKRPPSYHTDDLRAKPIGHYFDVITNGWGTMPSYSDQIPPQDRWAIIAYVRALQLSQAGAADGNASNQAVGGGQGARLPTPVRGQQ
jgi:mono/diheme cytochrome c family protein